MDPVPQNPFAAAAQPATNGSSPFGVAPAARQKPASFEPAVAERPAPAPFFKEVASAPAVVAPAGQQKGGYAHGGMPQLVLRAIFGVSH
ncbi:hypothetical protein N9F48_03305 [Akkermansiaceae bacterium]|nr:hypothetical protein [Akkermansiaceae bacterium]